MTAATTIPCSITPHSINLFLDGRMRTISSGTPKFTEVKDLLLALQNADDSVRADLLNALKLAVDVPAFLAKITEGKVQVGSDEVRYNGEKVGGVMVDRILAAFNDGLDIRPLCRFMDRLNQNPTFTAREEMYLWLESGNLPITADGCFLAFKKVNDEYRSYHASPDGSHELHAVGCKPSMPREKVDPDRHNTCSRGYHFCSYDYLNSYVGDSGHVMVVKVAPEDVVAIPSDYHNTKGRAWTYEVVDEVPHDEAKQFFTTSVTTAYSDEDVVEADEAAAADTAAAIDKAVRKVRKALKKAGKKATVLGGDGKKHSIKKLRKAVKKDGQRATAIRFGIARATLQRALGATF